MRVTISHIHLRQIHYINAHYLKRSLNRVCVEGWPTSPSSTSYNDTLGPLLTYTTIFLTWCCRDNVVSRHWSTVVFLENLLMQMFRDHCSLPTTILCIHIIQDTINQLKVKYLCSYLVRFGVVCHAPGSQSSQQCLCPSSALQQNHLHWFLQHRHLLQATLRW